MSKRLHLLVLVIIALSLLLLGFRCPFDVVQEFEVYLVSPADGDTIYAPEVTLRWDVAYTGSREIWCTARFGAPPEPRVLSLPTTNHYIVYRGLSPATTYYWNASAYDCSDLSYFRDSEIRSFTTNDVFFESGWIYSPTPDSGVIGVSVNPNFAWEVYNPDLTPYDFDIYLGTTTDPPLLASGLSAPWYTLTSDTLDYSTLYYWRVESYYGTDTVEGPLWEFTTDYPSDVNIFALLEIDARQTPSGYHVEEEIRARFDTGTAIDAPIEPLQADAVTCEGVSLVWNASNQNYSFTEYSMPFIENGQPADFLVTGNSDVPDLNTNIIFPACTLGIISPESFNTVSISGFEVTWDGTECSGTVWLTVLDGTDSTGVWKEVANDGLDSLTASDLAPLGGVTGTYNLAILKFVEENIDAPGYRIESLIRARAFNVMEQINIYSK